MDSSDTPDPADPGAGPPWAGFEPQRPASQKRKAYAFVLGAVVWALALVIAVILLRHSHILRTLLLVTVVSWGFFALALSAAIALRRREERRVSP
ncbi:hypothetical protein [Streptomyces sp. ODS28]|uniref:hypothetical protein n=1 Tax=Streptomyces sp. ODS28 TaxID=3136688 RepID=UPI0031EC4FFA